MKNNLNLNNIDQFYTLCVELKAKGNIIELILSNPTDEILVRVSEITTYLCNKEEYNDFVVFKDRKCFINGIECDIIHTEAETHQEFQDWCNYLDTLEL